MNWRMLVRSCNAWPALPPACFRFCSNAAVYTRLLSFMSNWAPTRTRIKLRINSSALINRKAPSIIKVSISNVISLRLASTRSYTCNI